ncbi:hypothetical protein PIROE2DRAFT_16035, partial [Piromyces sp. E2]
YCITIDAIAFSYSDDYVHAPLLKEFNKYAKENGINIRAKLNLLTLANSTVLIGDYGTTLETILKRKDGKYDLIFYDNVYPIRFGPYLVDLKKVLPPGHVEMYASGIASETCVYKDKWVGLKKTPDTDLSAYNGLFDTAMGMCSIYEFMYSFRDRVSDPFPDLLSDNAVKALETMKRLKERISSDDEFISSIPYTIGKLMSGRSIFMKYWNNMSGLKYSLHRLPGGRPGISGSCVGGSNVGINLSSSKERQEAAATIIEYMTKRETQKNIIMTQNVASGITSLYDEDDVCDVVDCKLIKSIQLVNRPIHVNEDYDSYSTFFRTRIYDFLYGNKTAIEVLREINDYTKIYDVSMNTEETSFVLGAGFLELGKITETKCQMKWSLFSLGTTLNLIPVLYKMIVCFPETNKYSVWISNNRYIFLGIFVLLDLIISLITIFQPYGVTLVKNPGSYNFVKCAIYFDFFEIFFVIITSSININNYKAVFIINELILILYAITNYMFIYGYKIILPFIMKNKGDDILRNGGSKVFESSKRTRYDTHTHSNLSVKTDGSNSKISNIKNKIMAYHYQSSSVSNPSLEEGYIKSSKIENSIISENKLNGMSENALDTKSTNSNNFKSYNK